MSTTSEGTARLPILRLFCAHGANEEDRFHATIAQQAQSLQRHSCSVDIEEQKKLLPTPLGERILDPMTFDSAPMVEELPDSRIPPRKVRSRVDDGSFGQFGSIEDYLAEPTHVQAEPTRRYIPRLPGRNRPSAQDSLNPGFNWIRDRQHPFKSTLSYSTLMRPSVLASQVEACTGIEVKQYRKIATGWENVVLEVNGEYIFRVPMFRNGWTRLRREVLLLSGLSRRLSVSVPHYEFVWEGDRGHPQRFAGYRKIQGVPMVRGSFRRAWVDRLGEDLGHFLTELHSLRLKPREQQLVTLHTVQSWRDSDRRFYRQVRRLAYPLLRHDDRVLADAFWKDFFERITRHSFVPKFIHRDLTGGNIIIDPSRSKLIGVIDWGDAQVGDPAFDFVGLFEVNTHLGERALDTYGRRKEGFSERVDMYFKTIPFVEISWGVRQRARRFVELGLRHFRQRLALGGS